MSTSPMDRIRQGTLGLLLVLTAWGAAAALQLSETAPVTTLVEAPVERLALARIEQVEVSPAPPAVVVPSARVAAPIRPLLGGRSLGPGTDIDLSEPWSLSGVGADLCTTGREAHCTKPEGALSRPETVQGAGWLPEEEVDRAIRAHLAPAEACYRQALMARPELAGSVLVELEVSREGTVGQARLAESTLRAPSAEACLVDRFRRLRFPPPAGGAGATIRWRLLLTPG